MGKPTLARIVASSMAVAAGSLLAATANGHASPSAPYLTVSPTAGIVGAAVTLTGTGYLPDSHIHIYYDLAPSEEASSSRTNDPSTVTDSSGGFQLTILMPAETYGVHQVCVSTDPVTGCAQFTVQPHVVLNPSSGPPGTTFDVTATGFPAGELVAIELDLSPNPYLGTPGPMADYQGSFSETLRWPVNASAWKVDPTTPGAHQLCGDTAYPGSTQMVPAAACAQFLVSAVTANISLNPASGPDGTVVTVRGSGFPPNLDYVVSVSGGHLLDSMCGDTVQPIVTDANGAFEMRITIQPKLQFGGCQPITIHHGTNAVCANTGTAATACADFVLLGHDAPSPGASAGSSPLGTPRPVAARTGLLDSSPSILVIAVAFFALVLFGAGAMVWWRRTSRSGILPPAP